MRRRCIGSGISATPGLVAAGRATGLMAMWSTAVASARPGIVTTAPGSSARRRHATVVGRKRLLALAAEYARVCGWGGRLTHDQARV
jgi:hypothetical protein